LIYTRNYDSSKGQNICVVDPDPDPWECGSGSRRAKMTHKKEKREEISCFKGCMFFFEGLWLLP
jgi:hypothetical protein